MNTNILAAGDIAKNRANANAMALYDIFAKALAPFVGQKILKADGSFLAKVRAAFPKIDIFYYRNQSNYSVSFVAKESENIVGGCGCVYEESTVYIGDLNNGVLVKLYERPTFRTDYCVEEIQMLRQLAEKARDDARQAESKLDGFGFYDR